MDTYHSHLIAREGWRFIAAVALAGLVLQVSVGFLFAIPFWIATLVLCLLFRDPKRIVPPKPLAIVSPVDGKVTDIDTLQDPYTEIQMVQIQLSKGFFDVMTTRSPIEGKILKQWFALVDTSADTLINTSTDSEGTVNQNPENEIKLAEEDQKSCEIVSEQPPISGKRSKVCRFAQWIQSDEQDNVVMAVKSATSIFKPRCYSHSGDRIGQGQRCGIIPFTAVVHVSVPVSSRVEVKIGDTVRGGSDTLATLVH
jgi:phosphatidylserine decarboxylase